jgi:hypothetical protein
LQAAVVRSQRWKIRRICDYNQAGQSAVVGTVVEFRFWIGTIKMRIAFRAFSLLMTVLALNGANAADNTLGYRRDVLPILSDRCFKCHGPDSASRQAGLRLDRSDTATAELDSGVKAIVPGDANKSALVERIMSEDADVMMPPPDSGKRLSAAEKKLLVRWIKEGAQYEPHWAFVAPVRPAVPQVKHATLVNNPIDAFVLSRLEHEGIEPSPRATKERLIRRLNFDIVGLPPTIAQIDAFLADNSADAYQKVVDELLASPHYGERMAADWLDGARYADSNGYQNDFARNMSPWRDWVIAAFNRNMPYDQFVIEQIAGDLLPGATLQQRIATGFSRNHRMVTEAGSIDEEWHVENVVDRVETMGTVMLGLTVGCGRCHDHKFDPMTQREFYQLYAFFNSINEKGVYTETRGNVPPLVKAITPENEKKLAEFDSKNAALAKQIADEMASMAPHRKAWLESLATATDNTEPEAVARIDLRGNAKAIVAATDAAIAPDKDSRLPKFPSGLIGKAAAFNGKQHIEYAGLNLPPSDRPYSWSVWVKPAGDGAIISKMDSAAAYRGCDLHLFPDGKFGMHIVDHWPDNALKVVSQQPLLRDKWSHIVATYDGSSKAAGITLYVNGKKQEVTAETDKLTGSFATVQPLRVGMRSTDSLLHAQIADVRIFQHALSAAEVGKVSNSALKLALKDVKLDKLDSTLLSQFDVLFFGFSTDPFVVKIADTKRLIDATQSEKSAYDAAIPTTMVMEELPKPRDTYLLQRGRYDQPDKSAKLEPNVPAFLPPLPPEAPRNRLGLARWLVSSQNPLTARVIVNRLWQRFFGIGLVKTADNFGIQSEPPSHPELLDWLATELVSSGWDLEHIERLIVASNTYQQQSEAATQAYQRDPENRLLARGPRHRLPAEAVRDNALSVSGLLSPKIGGPSAMPYQPEGLWEELAGGAFEVYTQGHGDDLYRRSLYVYRKRTVPHPSMATFDAPSWEICQVKRATTDTPLQSLALLNDVTYVEAARKFAERMLTEGGSSAEARLTFAFRLATGRSPAAAELDSLRKSLDKYEARFRQSPAAAEEFVTHGEAARNKSLDAADLAAHTAIASVLLNLDETLSKN